MRRLCQIAALAASAGFAPAAALSTLHQPAAGYDVVSYNTWQASSFTLAETAGAYRVRQVALHMAQIVPNSHLVLRITGSALGRPDNSDVRAELRVPGTLAAAPGVVNFAASAVPDPLLTPGQTYWLVLGITAPDNDSPLPAGLVRWSYGTAASAEAPAAAGWTAGCCTATSGTGGADWQPAVNTPALFAINARPPGAAAPAVPGISQAAGILQLTARGTPGVNYDIECASGLTGWSPLGSAFADQAGIIRFTEAVAGPQKFYRFQ